MASAYAAALAYFAAAPHLPALGLGEAGFVAPTAFGLVLAGGLVAITMPFRERRRALVVGLVAAGLAGVALTAAGEVFLAAPAKVLAAASAGFLLGGYVRVPAILYAVAAAVLVVDTASVTTGPTKVIIEEHERLTDFLTVAIPEWGDPAGGAQLGISDLIFLAGYLSCAWRFGLRRRPTTVALVASFIGSMAIGTIAGQPVPALPLLSVALIAPNADIVWRHLRSPAARNGR